MKVRPPAKVERARRGPPVAGRRCGHEPRALLEGVAFGACVAEAVEVLSARLLKGRSAEANAASRSARSPLTRAR